MNNTVKGTCKLTEFGHQSSSWRALEYWHCNLNLISIGKAIANYMLSQLLFLVDGSKEIPAGLAGISKQRGEVFRSILGGGLKVLV
ncbi:hypothetical protein [Hoeflea prorocentri]|uniref:Uncharacterized protein n=1 Tax=Hoeflea prorocentri TaxID=1922333 RepID=A0A9X3ZIT2_9HYPH|nr:hypothetical protein [Hoeflea prorocentri]MCY6383232.1 hypothetical protein [Hoeflea prorocentri]MDA5401032.1 hypothetical protein [Hoeflea prorocentri]